MAEHLDLRRSLPVGSVDHHAAAWWGMWTLIATEAALFAYLLFSYAYLAGQIHGSWVPELPRLRIAAPNTVLLLASSAVLYWGEQGIKQGRRGQLLAGLALTLVMGVVFVALQGVEWHNKHYTPADSAYASTYFVTTGFHMAHVVGGLFVLATLLLWTLLGKFGKERHAAVSVGTLYWHFVDVVWIAVFLTYYISPYVTS